MAKLKDTTLGAGIPETIDGASPGADGNVALGAVRYTEQTLSDAQKGQARNNIAAASTNDATLVDPFVWNLTGANLINYNDLEITWVNEGEGGSTNSGWAPTSELYGGLCGNPKGTRDSLSLSWSVEDSEISSDVVSGSTLTATRLSADDPGYAAYWLGSQSDKPLAPAGDYALKSEIPAVVPPSSSAETGDAADAKATGDALDGKQDAISDLAAIRSGAAKGANSVQQASTYRMDIAENGDVTVSPNGAYVYESKYGVRDQSNQLSACFNQTNVSDYSDSASYGTGDLVVYDGRTYECMAYPYSPGTSPDDDPSAWSLAVAADIRGFFVRIALSQPVSSTAPAEAHAEVLYFFGPLVGGDDRYDLRPAFEFDAMYAGGQLGNASNLSLYEVLQKDGTSIPVTSDMYGVASMQTAQITDNTGAGGPFVVAGGPLVWSLTDPGFSMPASYTIPRQVTTLTVDDHFISGGTNPVQNGVITTKFSLVDATLDAIDANKANSVALAPNFSPGQGAAYREVGDLVTYLGYMYRCKVAGYDSQAHVPGQDASYWDQVSVSDIVGNINSVLDAINGEVI